MSVSGGDIVIELALEDKNFKATVRNTGVILSQLTKSIDESARSLRRMETNQASVAKRFRDMVLTVGNLRFVMMDINDVFLRLPASILKTAGDLEKTQKLMEGVSKKFGATARAAEAASDFSFVVNLAKNAPFALSSLSDSFVKLKTAGIDPTKGALQTMVDSVAKFGGTSDTLKRATIAIQQMAGKGVISMEELRQQLGEAIPTAMQDMADGMGMSMAELTAAVSKGTVASGGAINKMLLRMQVNNAGAAEKMMETWVGMTSRLKTEWELTAKFIADAGLGDQAKIVVKELTDALASGDFKRFATSVGASLGDAVEVIGKVGKALIEYRKEILLVGQAWLAYKAYTNFVYPLQQAMRATFLKTKGLITEQVVAAQAAAEKQKAISLENIASGQQEAVAAKARAADAITAKQFELQEIRVINAQMLAEKRALDAAMAAKVNLVQIKPGIFEARTLDDIRRRHHDLSLAIDGNSASVRKFGTEISAEKRLLQEAAATIAANEVKTRALASATTGLTRAKIMLKSAMTGLGTAFTLVGGWLTVLTIAVTIATAAWIKWGRAAEEAAGRAMRAKLRLSTAGDVSDYKDEAKKRAQATKDAEIELGVDKTVARERGATGIYRLKTDAEKSADLERVKAAKTAELETAKNLQRAEQAVFDQLAAENARGLEMDTQKRVKDIEDANKAEIQASKAGLEKKLSGLKKGDKDYQAARNAATAEQFKIVQKGRKETLGALEQQGGDLKKKIEGNLGTPEELAAAKVELTRITNARTDLAEQIRDSQDVFDAANEMVVSKKNPKVKTAEGRTGRTQEESPIKRLLATLRGDAAALKAETDAYVGSLNQLDKGVTAAARMKARIENGLYNQQVKGKDGKYHVEKPTQDEANQAIELARKNASEKQAMQAAEDFAEKGRTIQGDYERAKAMLADPLGIKSDGGRVADFQKQLAVFGPDIMQRIADATGQSVKDVKKKIKEVEAQLATIDLAAPYRELVDSSRTLGNELVLNDRDRVRQQMTLENERYRVRMQNIIDEKKAAGAPDGQIANLQAELNKNTELRSQNLAMATRTPIEKLADDWADKTKMMKDATARWAQSGVDAMVNFCTTGKGNFADMTKSILADLLKMELQAQASSIFKAMGGGAGMAAGIASIFGFANGGIMSSSGSMPLKKYANGGIANSPQMAVFGEGDHNEAYVPLPDGRTIPVTMTGQGAGGSAAPGSAGAPSVMVNVINQSGNAVGAQQQGGTRFDGKSMVLDVVLSAANSPGPFRDSLKQAMR